MTNEEILKLLKESHDHGYEHGWNKGKDSGIRSIAIGIDPGWENKSQSWEKLLKRIKFD